jgi:hypothetical protein
MEIDPAMRRFVALEDAEAAYQQMVEEVEKWKAAKVRYQKRCGIEAAKWMKYLDLAREAAGLLGDVLDPKGDGLEMEIRKWLQAHPELEEPGDAKDSESLP